MIDLITEMLGYIALAALIGLAIGYLLWGWDRRRAPTAASGMVDGVASMRARLAAALEERDRLRAELARLHRPAPSDGAPEAAASDPAEDATGSASAPSDAEPATPGPGAASAAAESVGGAVVEATRDIAAPPPGLLDEAPDAPDDLTRITGVGPRMQRALNANGIHLFRQIADLSDADVIWVNEAIRAFPGRIERDRWVEQARDLLRERRDQSDDA